MVPQRAHPPTPQDRAWTYVLNVSLGPALQEGVDAVPRGRRRSPILVYRKLERRLALRAKGMERCTVQPRQQRGCGGSLAFVEAGSSRGQLTLPSVELMSAPSSR